MPTPLPRPKFIFLSGDLIPGLPNSVVLDCLIPRLPWYCRPRLRSLSRAWFRVLQEPALFSSLTRAVASHDTGGLLVVHQLSPSASEECFHQLKLHKRMPPPHCLSIYDEECQRWRQIPPIPNTRPLRMLHDCGIASVARKVFVMGGWDPRTDVVSAQVHMLDLGSGLWQWQKRSNMHSAKSLFFCKPTGSKIYVVGGCSSQNHCDEPLPEVYDVQNDKWEKLPKVTLSRSFNYNGLAVAGDQILAFGLESLEKGQLINFWRLYDPSSKKWKDWDCDHSSCSNLLAGDHDLREGFVNKLDPYGKKWEQLDGRVCTKSWRWEGGRRVFCDSTCAHNFFVVKECGGSHVYATICERSENKTLTIWRGDVNYALKLVSWCQVEPPGNLSMCSEMCYLQD